MIRWSADLAYVVGLIATDGCLSNDGRHIDLTSKDLEQLQNFKKILKLNNKIGLKSSGYLSQKCTHVQFGNVKLYRFLLSIGLTPRKSKTLGPVKVPDKYFRDFLRGSLDGDGCIYSYWDKRWRSSFMVYVSFVSASKQHVLWLQEQITKEFSVEGQIKLGDKVHVLIYAKTASIALLNKIYYREDLTCLSRKRFKFHSILDIIAGQAGML